MAEKYREVHRYNDLETWDIDNWDPEEISRMVYVVDIEMDSGKEITRKVERAVARPEAEIPTPGYFIYPHVVVGKSFISHDHALKIAVGQRKRVLSGRET